MAKLIKLETGAYINLESVVFISSNFKPRGENRVLCVDVYTYGNDNPFYVSETGRDQIIKAMGVIE